MKQWEKYIWMWMWIQLIYTYKPNIKYMYALTKQGLSHLRWQEWWLSVTCQASQLERTPDNRSPLQRKDGWMPTNPWSCLCLWWTAHKLAAAVPKRSWCCLNRCSQLWQWWCKQTWIPTFSLAPHQWSTGKSGGRGTEWSCYIRGWIRTECSNGDSPPWLKELRCWLYRWSHGNGCPAVSWSCKAFWTSSCCHWGPSGRIFLSIHERCISLWC